MYATTMDDIVYPRPEPTVKLHIDDIRPANEFDRKLLDVEGARFGTYLIRGGRLVHASDPAPPVIGPGLRVPYVRWILERIFGRARS